MDIFWNHTLWNQACAAGVKFMVCDISINDVNSLLFHYFYMFLLKQNFFVMNPRMVLTLTCN